MNKVVGHLGEILESVCVVVAGGAELVGALIAREGDGMDGAKDVLEGESGLLKLIISTVGHLVGERLRESDDTGNVSLADFRVGRGITERRVDEARGKGVGVAEDSLDSRVFNENVDGGLFDMLSGLLQGLLWAVGLSTDHDTTV